LKILLLGSHLNYNLEHYVKMNLEKMRHEVVFYGYREKLGKFATPIRMAICRSRSFRQLIQRIALEKINEEIKRTAQKLRPDFVLSIKGEAVEPKTIEWIKSELGAKTALWYPDDPRFFNSLVKYIAPSYDHVFSASEKAVDMYKEIGVENIHYLPFACEPTVHKKVELSDGEKKRYCADIVFVGTYCPRRSKIIRPLEKAGIGVRVYGPYWKSFKLGRNACKGLYGPEMVKVFSSAKLVLNIHDETDMHFKANMRTFEVSGSDSFMLSDKPCGLEKLFNIGEEIICYDNESELVELAKCYLEVESDRSAIAARAQQKAYREHTYEQRMKEAIRMIG